MSLFSGTSSGGGGNADRLPYVKYNAKAGRLYRVDREQIGPSEWATSEEEITNTFSAVFDPENIEIGWIYYPTGAAPLFAVSRIGEPKPARPSNDFKEGFVITMKLAASCADGKPAIRQLSGNAKVVQAGIDAFYTEYQAGKGANPGMLPVVSLAEVTPITTENKYGKQTNFQPVFKITKWVKRPDDLVYKATPISEAPASTPAPVASSAPPSTGSTRVDPPKAKAAELEDAEF